MHGVERLKDVGDLLLRPSGLIVSHIVAQSSLVLLSVMTDLLEVHFLLCRRVHADGVQGPLTFVCGVGILCGGFGVSLKERLKIFLRERKKTPDAPS
jgi:hypothetical protein